MKRFLHTTIGCFLLILPTLPALAIGRLADVNLIDRSNGQTLPVYVYRGEYWVAGQPNARYAISIRNYTKARLLAVTSVDGVNVLNGASAGYNQNGYVFDGREYYEIIGWRKSDREVAAFEFASAGESYAAQTGRADHVGVIGVALFKERVPVPTALAEPSYAPDDMQEPASALNQRSHKDYESSSSAEANPETQRLASKKEAANSGVAGGLANSVPAPAPVQRLGTGHGERETSQISYTEFERTQTQPNEVIRIRYDSRESLIARGIIPNPQIYKPKPQPFPQSEPNSYVPDPPARESKAQPLSPNEENQENQASVPKPRYAQARHPQTRQRLYAGDIVTHPQDFGPPMVVLPKAPPEGYLMGSPDTEPEHQENEKLHRVTIPYVFAMSQTHVTFDDWGACVRGGGCQRNPQPEAEYGKGRMPLINIYYNDALAYVAWLNRSIGIRAGSRNWAYRYRIPSEIETEYATRAGTTTPFYTGDNVTTEQANYNGWHPYNGNAKGQDRARTTEVGSFEPNAFGLYDMIGNVQSWQADCYEKDYSKIGDLKGKAYREGDNASSECYHSLRGSSYWHVGKFSRSAFRSGLAPFYENRTIGLRLVRTLPSIG